MRLLLDNNPSPRMVVDLRTAGHDVEHVRDHGLGSALDDQVLGIGSEQDRSVVVGDNELRVRRLPIPPGR